MDEPTTKFQSNSVSDEDSEINAYDGEKEPREEKASSKIKEDL